MTRVSEWPIFKSYLQQKALKHKFAPATAREYMAKNLFISHISEEVEPAVRVKTALERDFLGLVEVFVSSDTESIAAGELWLTSIEEALQKASMLVILCSPQSIARPWINFEAGAAWVRKIPLIPVCHAGLAARDLPMPLSLHQGIALADPEGFRRLYARVAEALVCRIPVCQFEELARELSKLGGRHNQPDTADIDARLHGALEHSEFKWRTLARLAAAAATPEEVAARLLRADPNVRFSRSRRGEVIVGLISRVGRA
jgi:hypothetical protein